MPGAGSEVVSLPVSSRARQWASEVLGVTGSGHELHLKVATKWRLPEGGSRVEYGVYSFELTSHELTLLTELPGGFGVAEAVAHAPKQRGSALHHECRTMLRPVVSGASWSVHDGLALSGPERGLRGTARTRHLSRIPMVRTLSSHEAEDW